MMISREKLKKIGKKPTTVPVQPPSHMKSPGTEPRVVVRKKHLTAWAIVCTILA
jgi:hypothetical protein